MKQLPTGRHWLALSVSAGVAAVLGVWASEGHRLDLIGGLVVGLGLTAGMLVGGAMARRVGQRFDPWFRRQRRRWTVLGLISGFGFLVALAVSFGTHGIPFVDLGPWTSDAFRVFGFGLWTSLVLGIGFGHDPGSIPSGRKTLGLGAGFGVGGGLGLLVESATHGMFPWQTAASYGLGLAAAVLATFPVWRRVGEWISPWLFRRARNAALFGLAPVVAMVAGTSGWWELQWLPLPETVSWLSDVLAAFALGLWNTFLLGIGFGSRFVKSPSQESPSEESRSGESSVGSASEPEAAR